ncbi:hypothetical protein BpHYR1_039925 [Brachionus plicatilis]|uniref:Uncharacterized protein n=1 Tax=Brachionus plicatilis TaxID=10195 RepID=A0A3M7QBK1_BRAPC|nr:hypothetical protein BpHYR1_039925 [Brachionus plicatilis]
MLWIEFGVVKVLNYQNSFKLSPIQGKHPRQDENIKQSIKEANKFLKTIIVKNVFERIFRIDFDQCTRNIKLVRILYSVPNEEAKKGHTIAWTERTGC